VEDAVVDEAVLEALLLPVSAVQASVTAESATIVVSRKTL
jgi:hypothetical protein